ncbi:MAG: hypothetical protein CL561_01695 [Alphaproteobacteria bacterium]|nr:hypothetical protein [Alphaproteobacteria bacterium]|tara:strand:+ start:6417 stop:6614 length:198 start_codon:yes stop_codon:yes gene_type:complete
MHTELLSVKEACVALNCGVTKLYKLFNDQKIKAIKCEGRTFVTRAEIEAFIASLENYKPQKMRDV